MHNKKPIYIVITIFYFLFVTIGISAKTLQVVDEQKETIAGATVSIVSENDSLVIFATISDDNGFVNLPERIDVPSIIHVKSIGFESFSTPYSPDLSKIILSESTSQLSEVTVTAQSASLVQKAGKFIFDPGSLKKNSTDCYNLLKNTPLLTISEGGAISILGKGKSIIHINGRDPMMPHQAIIEMLKSLPPSRIKRIEIITSPGSKYSANMTGGIVNVILDKPNEGFIGSTGLDVNFINERVDVSPTFWGGYTKGRLNLSANLLYSRNNHQSKFHEEYEYSNIKRYVENLTHDSGYSNSLGTSINASYNLTKRSIIALALNIGVSDNFGHSYITSRYIDDGIESTSFSKIRTESPWTRPLWGIGGYYTIYTDTRGSKFEIKANYSSRKSINQTDYFFNNDPIRQSTEVNSNGFSIKPSYSLTFSDSHSIEAGYQVYYSYIDNEYSYPGKDNQFIYKEAINSGFAEWNAQWNDVIDTRLGLRVENTDIHGNQLIGDEKFHRNYTDFSPSFNIGLTLPGKGNSISLSLNRYIIRPYYSDLNPFIYWTSETTYRKGNPYAESSKSWEYSVYARFLNGFTATLSYSFDPSMMSQYQYREGDYTVSSVANFGHQKKVIISLDYYKNLTSWWLFRGQCTAIYENIDANIDDNNDIGVKEWQWTANIRNTFNFKLFNSPFQATLSYNIYPATTMVARRVGWKHLMSASLSKSFLGDRMSLSLYFANILNSKSDESFYSPDYSYYKSDELCAMSIFVSARYTFGKLRVRGAQDRYQSDLDQRFR